MENYENLIKTLTDKLDKQSRELQSIKSKLGNNSQSKKNHLNESFEKSPRTEQNSVKGRGNHFEDYCFKEYTYTERVYYPNKEDYGGQRKQCDFNRNGSDYFPQAYVPYEHLKQKKNGNQSDKSYLKPHPISEAVLKVRQNHLPFIIDKAYHHVTCRACKWRIKNGSTMIIHKEIVPSPSAKDGWERPIFSKYPVTQFYHFDKNCLELRGFEVCYLAVCYVEVGASVSLDDRARIRDLGFKRKVREKTQIIVSKEKTVKVVPGEKSGEVVPGEKSGEVVSGEKSGEVVSGEKSGEVSLVVDVKPAMIVVEGGSDGGRDGNDLHIQDDCGMVIMDVGKDTLEEVLRDAAREEDSVDVCENDECEFDFCG